MRQSSQPSSNRSGVILVCALLTAAATGCSLYDPSLLKVSSALRRPPPRPAMEDGPEDIELVMALRGVVLRQSNSEWREIGFDLDGFDTTDERLEQACEPQPVDGASVQLDGVEGIDNVFGDAYYDVVDVGLGAIEPQDDARAAHEIGRGTIIARMKGWNGTPNDPKVTVAIAQAVDGTPLDPSEVQMQGYELVRISDGTPAPPPAWDGTDHWWLRSDGFQDDGLGDPWIEDTNAYVVNGQVVHRLANGRPIVFVMGELAIRVVLNDAYVVATLNDTLDGLTDAIVAGRWPIQDLSQTGGNVGLCLDDPQRVALDGYAKATADVTSSVGFEGPGAKCDAISTAIRFESGVRGSIAGISPAPPLPDLCGEGNAADGGV